MKFKKVILFLIIFSSIFLFSGCSGDLDCSSKDTNYEKYELNEDEDECVLAKQIPKNKCGNNVAEEGENYCNCPEDVSKTHPEFGCEGTLGKYLEKKCNENTNKCELTQNEKVIEETKSLEFRNSDLTFNAKVMYDNPYIINTQDNNKIKFDIELFKYNNDGENYKNIIVKELRVEDSNSNLLATIDYNKPLTSLGDKLPVKNIGLSDTKEYEDSLRLYFNLVISYDVEKLDRDGNVYETENEIQTLKTSISRFEVINPNFYKEEK